MARIRSIVGVAVLMALLPLTACRRSATEEAPSEHAPAAAQSGVLTVGSVSLNPTQEFETVRPFARFVASRLGEVGIGKGRVVVVDSLSKMIAEITEMKISRLSAGTWALTSVDEAPNTAPLPE